MMECGEARCSPNPDAESIRLLEFRVRIRLVYASRRRRSTSASTPLTYSTSHGRYPTTQLS